jgi:flagellar L-ring protein precursor FlgH
MMNKISNPAAFGWPRQLVVWVAEGHKSTPEDDHDQSFWRPVVGVLLRAARAQTTSCLGHPRSAEMDHSRNCWRHALGVLLRAARAQTTSCLGHPKPGRIKPWGFNCTVLLVLAPVLFLRADPPAVGSVWSHAAGSSTVSTAPMTSICSDPLAHSVGDLLTIVVTLQNSVTKAQNTTTAKATSVAATVNQLVYPGDSSNHGWSWYTYHGQNPGMAWNSNQTFNGGGTIANTEATSTTIQARVIAVGPNGVLRIEATRLSKAGEENTSMILTGLVRPEDLSTNNVISSDNVADLEILQKGKGTLTEDQRKGWLTKLDDFINPF